MIFWKIVETKTFKEQGSFLEILVGILKLLPPGFHVNWGGVSFISIMPCQILFITRSCPPCANLNISAVYLRWETLYTQQLVLKITLMLLNCLCLVYSWCLNYEMVYNNVHVKDELLCETTNCPRTYFTMKIINNQICNTAMPYYYYS